MLPQQNDIIAFLLRAKAAAYAGDGPHAASSRPASIDLPYQEGDLYYYDTYLGGLKFIGEEAVWQAGTPLWGMNYYGWMEIDDIPAGFSPFLKAALRHVPEQAPFRGPQRFADGAFTYRCKWQGEFERYTGREAIFFNGQKIYELVFHGGSIR